jgi:hypothetical protein
MESSSQSSTQHESEPDAIHSSSNGTSSKAVSAADEQEKLDEELARKLSMPRMTRAQLAAEAKKLEKGRLAELKKRHKERKERDRKVQRQEREKARAEKKKWYAQEMKERRLVGKTKKVVREVLGRPCCTNGLVKPQGWIGAYSPESRKVRLERFKQKRNHRVWTKKVKYGVRKNFADSRMRVKGRFVKKQDELLMRDLISLT